MFLEDINRVAKIFRSLVKEKKVKIVSHLDADGLTSAAILSKMLLREGVNFELRIVKQLTGDNIGDIEVGDGEILVLSDLGSGQTDLLDDILSRTHVLILDHHDIKKKSHLNLLHINSLLSGEEEISASMTCYLFAKAFDIRNVDSVPLAIIGAVGDELDEDWTFSGELASKILSEAVETGKMTVIKGLRLYGRYARPLHKSLEYSFDPFIPGISGSESGAVQMLCDLGIELKSGEEWRKLKDLTIEEQKRLASAIIIERLKAKHSDADDIFGDIFVLPNMPDELHDTREFATLLNACGRLGRYDIGLRLCFYDLTALKDSDEMIEEYRKAISSALEWVRSSDVIQTTEHASYLFAGGRISDTIIGTITSVLLNSNMVDTDKPVFGFADSNGKLKVSARLSKDVKQINLRDVIVYAIERLSGDAGGHAHAAGALIAKEDKDKFVEIIEEKLGEMIGGKTTG